MPTARLLATHCHHELCRTLSCSAVLLPCPPAFLQVLPAHLHKPMPPQGVRFNAVFHGEFSGPKLKGKMKGTDHLLMRAEGVGIINVQAVLATAEGDKISVHGSGTFIRSAEGGSSFFRQGRTSPFMLQLISIHRSTASKPGQREAWICQKARQR